VGLSCPASRGRPCQTPRTLISVTTRAPGPNHQTRLLRQISPSTGRFTPIMNDASSDARNAIALPTDARFALESSRHASTPRCIQSLERKPTQTVAYEQSPCPHCPLHQFVPFGQQCPAEHVWLALHCRPHDPQLKRSLCTLMQPPLQRCQPTGHELQF